jgi:type I restriction enzyme R subunit
VKTCGGPQKGAGPEGIATLVVVDYIGLAEEVQRAVADPTAEGVGKRGGFVTNLSELVNEFRTTFARIEDLLADVDGLDLTAPGFESVRAINDFLDANPGTAEVFAKDYRLLARAYPLINTDKGVAKRRDRFG